MYEKEYDAETAMSKIKYWYIVEVFAVHKSIKKE